MKCLVTGANGFLGSWLCRRLINDGWQVRVIHRPTSDLSEIIDIQGIEYVQGDVTNLESLIAACKNVDTVFHLAGLIAYTPTQRQAMEKINVEGTANVISACKKQDVKNLLHVSSVVAVGASLDGKNIFNEDTAYNLSKYNFGYFETKRKAEQLVVEASKEFRCVIVNPSTIYGAGDARKGSRKTQLKVARGEFKFYTGGGVNVISVENVVDGILKALEKGKNGERYILCGENITIKKLFELIAEEAAVKPPSILIPNAVLLAMGILGDTLQKYGKSSSFNSENARVTTMFHWFDSQKAQRELGFQPSTAKAAIHNSVKWIKEQGLLK